MTTSDWISLLALVVAAVSSIGNFFYTNRKLQLMKSPMLDAKLRLFPESHDKNPIRAISEGQAYDVRHGTTLSLRMKNLSSSLSVTHIRIRLEYGRQITWWWTFWHQVPEKMSILSTLNPLEQGESRLTDWEHLVGSIFPEHIKLSVQTDKEGKKFAYYAETKPISFPLRLMIQYTGGIPSAPLLTLRQEYSISSYYHGSSADGILWSLSEELGVFNRDDEWFNA